VAKPNPDFVGYEAGPDVVREQVAYEYREQQQVLHSHTEASVTPSSVIRPFSSCWFRCANAEILSLRPCEREFVLE
jgi:hypothetical protein